VITQASVATKAAAGAIQAASKSPSAANVDRANEAVNKLASVMDQAEAVVSNVASRVSSPGASQFSTAVSSPRGTPSPLIEEASVAAEKASEQVNQSGGILMGAAQGLWNMLAYVLDGANAALDVAVSGLEYAANSNAVLQEANQDARQVVQNAREAVNASPAALAAPEGPLRSPVSECLQGRSRAGGSLPIQPETVQDIYDEFRSQRPGRESLPESFTVVTMSQVLAYVRWCNDANINGDAGRRIASHFGISVGLLKKIANTFKERVARIQGGRRAV
jgi:hypothetical protein